MVETNHLSVKQLKSSYSRLFEIANTVVHADRRASTRPCRTSSIDSDLSLSQCSSPNHSNSIHPDPEIVPIQHKPRPWKSAWGPDNPPASQLAALQNYNNAAESLLAGIEANRSAQLRPSDTTTGNPASCPSDKPPPHRFKSALKDTRSCSLPPEQTGGPMTLSFTPRQLRRTARVDGASPPSPHRAGSRSARRRGSVTWDPALEVRRPACWNALHVLPHMAAAAVMLLLLPCCLRCCLCCCCCLCCLYLRCSVCETAAP